MCNLILFFFSSRRRHTRCALVTGVQTCALPIYVRGQPSDYDEWNCDGWRWADLKPHFKALENHELGASDMRGTGGPLNITIHPTKLPVLEAMIAAAAEMDVTTVEERKSVVTGKSVTGRVDSGGRRNIKKK